MLNTGKIRLMTDLAIYEKEHGDSVFKVNSYYKSDYVMGGVIAAFVRYTLCAVLILVCTILFRTDFFFSRINQEGISAVLREIGIYYAGGLFLYLAVAFALYSARYERAKHGVLLYATKLKRLQRKYTAPGARRA